MDVEAAWEGMAALADHGLVRWIGVSNFDREQLELCQRIRPVDSLEPNLSVLYRREQDLIEWCGEQGIGVIAYGPLTFGLLTGSIDAGTRFAPDDWRTGNTDVPPVKRLYDALPVISRRSRRSGPSQSGWGCPVHSSRSLGPSCSRESPGSSAARPPQSAPVRTPPAARGSCHWRISRKSMR
jgi:hypothetical protein